MNSFKIVEKKTNNINNVQFLIIKKGEKIIWVNCIRKNIGHENEWKKGILEMLDGGDNYFNLKINIRTKKYYEMYVNGFV